MLSKSLIPAEKAYTFNELPSHSIFPAPSQAERFFPLPHPDPQAYIEVVRTHELAEFGRNGNISLAMVASDALARDPDLRGVRMQTEVEEIIYNGRRVAERRKLKFKGRIDFY